MYQLVVVARDLGPESVPTSVTVTVKVTDTNDNAPEISVDTLTGNTGVAVASEDAEPGTFVAHVAIVISCGLTVDQPWIGGTVRIVVE